MSDQPVVSPFLQKLMSGQEKKFGANGVYVGDSQDDYTVGLPLPWLALQYLLDSSVFPLGCAIIFAGAPKSYKTTGLLEFARLVMSPPTNGETLVLNTESKWSNTKSRSVLRDLNKKLVLYDCSTVEDWQQRTTTVLTDARDYAKKVYDAKQSNRKSEYKDQVIPPILMILDSLTGAQSEYIRDKVLKDGAEKTFQDRAMLNKMWIQSVGEYLRSLPLTLLISNHLMSPVDANTPSYVANSLKGKKTPGGEAMTYHCTYEIRCQKMHVDEKSGRRDITIKWLTAQSTRGIDGRHIDVSIVEEYDEEGNQVTAFDWDTTLAKLLVRLTDKPNMLKGDIVDVIGEVRAPSTSTVACDKLGLATKDKVPTAELGRMIREDPTLCAQLQSAMKIKKGNLWTPETVFNIPDDAK